MGLFTRKPQPQPSPEVVERVKEIVREPEHDDSSVRGIKPYTVKTREEIEEEKWEQRRWELARHLVAQDRRSVILGKLNASAQAIARKARQLADATIEELRTNNIKSYGRENEK